MAPSKTGGLFLCRGEPTGFMDGGNILFQVFNILLLTAVIGIIVFLITKALRKYVKSIKRDGPVL